MHIYFPVSGRRSDVSASDTVADAGQLLVLRDPQDESEWQYLGNPEVATRTSLGEIVSRFLQDCTDAQGVIQPKQQVAATQLRDALLRAAQQIDDAVNKSAPR